MSRRNKERRSKNMSRQEKGPRINTSIESLPQHICECGSIEFLEIGQLKRCPALLSPTGVPVLIQAPLRVACAQCGTTPVWKPEDQPKIVTFGGKKDVQDVSVEGDVSPLDSSSHKGDSQ